MRCVPYETNSQARAGVYPLHTLARPPTLLRAIPEVFGGSGFPFAVSGALRYNIPVGKQKTSFRLSEETIEIIKEVSAKLGISQAAFVEIAVRRNKKLPEWLELVERETDN
jgi:hypothetical protein